MSKRTYLSVTERTCECGHLDKLVAAPGSPIKFDAGTQQYCIEYRNQSGDRAAIPIYHCILCGGAMKESTTSLLFETIPDSEQARLAKLTSELKTIADVQRILGQADHEAPILSTSSTEILDANRPTKSLRYSGISPVADIHVNAAPDGSVVVVLAPKRKKLAA